MSDFSSWVPELSASITILFHIYLSIGGTYYFSTSGSRWNSNKNEGSKGKSPEEDEGMYEVLIQRILNEMTVPNWSVIPCVSICRRTCKIHVNAK